jgi:hypothetical protein
MKSNGFLLFYFAMMFTTSILSSQSLASACKNNSDCPDNICYELNLKSTFHAQPPSYIKFIVYPEDSNSDGWYETVVKLTVNDPQKASSPEAVKFTITYDGEPLGVSVNIGDSISNDGFAGDYSHQSNDAELQIGNQKTLSDSKLSDDLLIYGKDGTVQARGTQIVAQANDFVKINEAITLTVANEYISFKNDTYPITGSIQSEWLYALNNQADSQGSVNFDIYASFNRVIHSESRIGSGVGHITICTIPTLKGSEDTQTPYVQRSTQNGQLYITTSNLLVNKSSEHPLLPFNVHFVNI